MTMRSPNDHHPSPPPLELSRWRKAPHALMAGGAALAVFGAVVNPGEFGNAWLLAFMFFLSLALGALFLVMVHHLSDAGWSVATRRVCEHIASLLFPWLAILFLPVALCRRHIYTWMAIDPGSDTLLKAKWPVFTQPGFCVASAVIFGLWWLLSSRLRYWSLKQDETGEARCTRRMRFHSGWGMVAFALTLTFAGVLWMQAVQYQWFSAIYGVYFFASCAWAALAALYLIMVLLQRQRILDAVLRHNQFYFLGLLFFAFTVFQAYAGFAQYFVVWNANTPSETFWYLIRENGSWWWVSLLLIFGHFLLPFFVLLPVKAKTDFKVMLPVCGWALAMNFLDLSFNILPAAHPHGYPFKWIPVQLGCLAFMGGLLSRVFLKNFLRHAPFPQKDPRLPEARGMACPDSEAIPDAASTTGGQP
jgi:hypothetical protein